MLRLRPTVCATPSMISGDVISLDYCSASTRRVFRHQGNCSPRHGSSWHCVLTGSRPYHAQGVILLQVSRCLVLRPCSNFLVLNCAQPDRLRPERPTNRSVAAALHITGATDLVAPRGRHRSGNPRLTDDGATVRSGDAPDVHRSQRTTILHHIDGADVAPPQIEWLDTPLHLSAAQRCRDDQLGARNERDHHPRHV